MAKGKASSNGTTAAETASVVEVQAGKQREEAATNETAAVMNGQTVDVEELQATEQTRPVVRPCGCGCGQPVSGKKSAFRMGHDSVHKSKLLCRHDAGDLNATQELIERGWRTARQLDDRREKASGKAAASIESKRERLVAKLDRAKAEVARLETELAALAG